MDDEELMSLVSQAKSTLQGYLQCGDVTGLDEAIDDWQQILQHPNFPQQDEVFQQGVLNNSAVTYWHRYRARDVVQDLDHALQTWQALVNNAPDLLMWLTNLSEGLRNRYARLGDLADLEHYAYCAAPAARRYTRTVGEWYKTPVGGITPG